MNFARLEKFIWIAFFFRAGFAAIRAFLPFDLPHIQRQVDTFGVSIRYWLRWMTESDLTQPLLPAVINYGDNYGLNAMEFPFINLATAPLFGFGYEYGRVLAPLLLYMAHFGLTWLCYRVWRNKELMGFRVGQAFLLLPIIGISSVFCSKYMPDYLAMILVLLATGLMWDQPAPHHSSSSSDASAGASTERRRAKFLRCMTIAKMTGVMLLLTLGMLIKVPAIIVLGLLWLRDGTWWQKCRHALWTIPPILVSALYYTFGIQWMEQFSDTPKVFATQFRDPLFALMGFLSEPISAWRLFFDNEIAFLAAPVLFVASLFFVNRQTQKQLLSLYLILGLQILFIIFLNGPHTFDHTYYLLGTSPLVALCVLIIIKALCSSENLNEISMQDNWKQWWNKSARRLRIWQGRRRLAYFVIVLIISMNVDTAFFELRTLFLQSSERFVSLNEAPQLKKRNPDFPWNQGYAFRTLSPSQIPALGVIFGERIGSTNSQYGFFLKSEPIPASCSIRDQSKNLVLVYCR